MTDETQCMADEGILTSRSEQGHLELECVPLQINDHLEICVLGSWLMGYIQYETSGWYLLTIDGVAIRLRSGLLARRCAIFIAPTVCHMNNYL